MENFLLWIELIEDTRQQGKIHHLLKDIVFIVLMAMLGNADEWEEIEFFAKENELYLKKYLELPNGIPSHDTIRRVMGMIQPGVLQQLQVKWQEMLDQEEGKVLKKIICIDGKTMRGNKRKGTRPSHIISAWSKESGYCLGQKAVDEKSNEITAIPELLDSLSIKGSVVTIDAMGTQTEIVKKIRNKQADYVLALKGNQGTLLQQAEEYFQETEFLEKIKESGNYKKTVEKAHGRIEKREYYQTAEISWLHGKGKWKGIKSIGMVESTLLEGEAETKEYRYYISSLPEEVALFEQAVRGHWSVEVMHWHLDVTFREDYNQTLDKTAAQNQNIMRKWCLSILKLIEVRKQKTSLKLKRFAISLNPMKYLEQIMEM